MEEPQGQRHLHRLGCGEGGPWATALRRERCRILCCRHRRCVYGRVQSVCLCHQGAVMPAHRRMGSVPAVLERDLTTLAMAFRLARYVFWIRVRRYMLAGRSAANRQAGAALRLEQVCFGGLRHPFLDQVGRVVSGVFPQSP